MAKDSLQTQRFIEALERDSSLQAQFELASPNSLGEIVDFASAKGYRFTKEELETALDQSPDNLVVEQLRQYVGYPNTESSWLRRGTTDRTQASRAGWP